MRESGARHCGEATGADETALCCLATPRLSQVKVGLRSRGLGSLFGSLLGGAQGEGEGPSVSERWVEYLMKETEPDPEVEAEDEQEGGHDQEHGHERASELGSPKLDQHRSPRPTEM